MSIRTSSLVTISLIIAFQFELGAWAYTVKTDLPPLTIDTTPCEKMDQNKYSPRLLAECRKIAKKLSHGTLETALKSHLNSPHLSKKLTPKKIKRTKLKSSIEISLSLDDMIKEIFTEKQNEFIKETCGLDLNTSRSLDESLPKESEKPGFHHLFENLTAENEKCIRKMDELWLDPDQLTTTLSQIQPFILNFQSRSEKLSHHSKIDRDTFVLSFIKNFRSKLVASFFQTRFLSELSKETGVSISSIEECTIGYGFNRLFSPHNKLGASPASDVDFKVVLDERCEKDHPGLKKEKVLKVLEREGEAFQRKFGITFEVEHFSVRTRKEIEDIIKKRDETELNFFATTLNSNTHLFGRKSLYDEVFRLKEGAFEKDSIYATGKSINQRIAEQYMKNSDKGSIGIIKDIEKYRTIAQGPEPTEGSARYPSYARAKKFTTKTFPGYYIGMPSSAEKDHSQDWTFSTKYTLLRLYDFEPDDLETQHLVRLGTRLQTLVVKFLVENRPSEIDSKYDKVTADDFKNLYLHKALGKQLRSVIEDYCKKKNTKNEALFSPEVCTKMKELQATRDEQKIKQAGFDYFSEVFRTALRTSTRLDPNREAR